MTHLSIGILGGDLRFVRLCERLCENFSDVLVYGITHKDIPSSATSCNSIQDLKDCDYIIGPIPFSKDNESVFMPLSTAYVSIDEFLSIACNKTVLVGALNDYVNNLFKQHHIHYRDLMKMDEIAILNAIPTAEGAIQYAMQNSEITLHDSKCLVLGFGRSGKILANKLRGIGAKVYVAARSTTDLAFIKTYDYTPVPIAELTDFIGSFNFIFNTIPVKIITPPIIDAIAPHTVYIEIASSPGGIDREYFEDQHLTYIAAPSLPGKVAPRSAADSIYHGLTLILRDQGVTI